MSKFRIRLMFVICGVLFSLVVALCAALIATAEGKDALGVLGTSAAAFVAAMTLCIAVLAVLLT